MAFDKNPSRYPSNGTIGSPEELDTYGVWVKSEPQDMASGYADTIGFGAGTMHYEADFEARFDTGFDDMDTGYDDMEVSGFSGIEDVEIPEEFDNNDFQVNSINDEMMPNEDQGTQTQLLQKIADELSSIRSEITTIKRDFIEIRSDSVLRDEAGGFFAEEDDEKIALTGDEMDNILSSAEFISEEDSVFGIDDTFENNFDSLRDDDEAALRRLSEENLAAMVDDEGEDFPQLDDDDENIEIEIDYDNLGINLDEEPESGEASEELALDEEFSGEMPDLDIEIGEMRDLRLEGVDHISLPPDNPAYLEEDPFSLEGSELEELTSEENALDLRLDDPSFELGLEDLDDIPSLELVDPLSDVGIAEESIFEEGSIEENILKEDSLAVLQEADDLELPDLAPAAMDEAPAEITAPVEEAVLDDLALELDDFETGAELEIIDDSLEVIPEGFEISAEEEPIPFEDDLDSFAEEDLEVTLDEEDLISLVEDIELSLASEDMDINLEESEAIAISLDEEDLDISNLPEIPAEDMEKYPPSEENSGLSAEMRDELRDVLGYMDNLLESLPDEKIKEFSQSEYFDSYRKIFKELGLAE